VPSRNAVTQDTSEQRQGERGEQQRAKDERKQLGDIGGGYFICVRINLADNWDEDRRSDWTSVGGQYDWSAAIDDTTL